MLKEDYNLYVILSFLAHLAKGQVSFCNHLSSVVNIQFYISSSETTSPIKPNLAGIVQEHMWTHFNIISDSSDLHSKWLLLLK